MAVSGRQYIFATFILSVLCSTLIIVSIATDSWLVGKAGPGTLDPNSLKYGLFQGELVLRFLATPTTHSMHMTCVYEVGACAQSCKTTPEARIDEVTALAQGLTPLPICTFVTIIDSTQPTRDPAVISLTFYILIVLVLVLHLAFALVAAGLAIFNATKNPTEPILGMPGVLWSNAICALFGLAALIMWGTYWTATGLKEHMAFAYIAVGELFPSYSLLGFSYWILIGSVLCAIFNVILVEARKLHLERDPAPPTINIESNSEGTIFLY